MKAYSFIEEAFAAGALNAARKFGGNTLRKAAQSPVAAGAAIGTGAGALKGALKKDENGQRHLIKGTLGGAMKGAAVGTLAGAAVKGGNALTRKMTGGTDMLKNAAKFGQKQVTAANRAMRTAVKPDADVAKKVAVNAGKAATK